MSKDYKGYELIKEITEGNIKEGTTIGVFDLSVCDIFVTNIVYKNKKLLWLEGKFDTSYLLNPNCYFRIVEEQEEIDIQSIEELEIIETLKSVSKNVSREENLRRIDEIEVNNFYIINDIIRQQNKLAKAVKQLDKNIKELGWNE